MTTIPINNAQAETETVTELRAPRLWKVQLLNDDFTPMDFVIDVLTRIFHKSEDQAIDLMLAVHTKGSATVGIYTKDVACTKADKTMTLASAEGHPLRVVAEPSE